MKEIVIAIFAFIICMFNTVDAYSDVNGHWAKGCIEELTEKNIIGGYPDGTFKPEGIITKAEFIVMLAKGINLEENKDCKKEHWADGYIDAVRNAGAIEEDEYEKLAKDEPITRYEILKIIVSSFKNSKEAYLSSEELKNSFVDLKQSSRQIKNMGAILKQTEIITGYPDNTARISNFLTRAEGCTVISRMIKNRSKIEEFNIVQDIKNYYDISKYIELEELPYELENKRYFEEEKAPVTTKIEEIEMFKFEGSYNGKYKDIFKEFYSSDIPYFEYRRKIGDGKYVIAIEFITTNNHPEYETTAGYGYLNMQFPEEEIEILDKFDIDEINKERNDLAYSGIIVKSRESYKTVMFVIVDKLPQKKVQFERGITTMYDAKNKNHVNISSFHSLVIGIE